MAETIQLDAIVNEVLSDPDVFREGRRLTPEEKNVIKPDDFWEVSFVDAIPEQTFKIIDNVFLVHPRHFRDYVRYQKEEWCAKQKYLLGMKLGREPTNLEMIEDAEKHKNYERFKLCYLLEHPEQVQINPRLYNKYGHVVGLFLAGAGKLDPKGRDFFGIIEKTLTARESPAA